MRLFTQSTVKHLIVGLGVALAASTAVASVAQAQSRKPLRVIVQKRSYFDAGNVVPVGSMNRYASQHFSASPVYSNTAELYGEGTLPSRTEIRANPFGNFYTPRD